MDCKLEVVVVPVSDVDRAKRFYSEQCGFVVDLDDRVSDKLRIVQLTPPGSACSITIGSGIAASEPGSLKGVQVVVSDIEAARAQLAERGVEVSGFKQLRGRRHDRWARRRLELVHLLRRSRRQQLDRAAVRRSKLEAESSPASPPQRWQVGLGPRSSNRRAL